MSNVFGEALKRCIYFFLLNVKFSRCQKNRFERGNLRTCPKSSAAFGSKGASFTASNDIEQATTNTGILHFVQDDDVED
jgi:hypothetical protein